MSQDKMPPRQNVTGQNVTQTKRYRIKRHLDKTSPRQNVTGQNFTKKITMTKFHRKNAIKINVTGKIDTLTKYHLIKLHQNKM